MTADPLRVLIVDPSPRGGIALYTAMVAEGLAEAGAEATILASRGLEDGSDVVTVLRTLPIPVWGKPEGAGFGFYLRKVREWLASAATIRRTITRLSPDVVHFQATINRRWDARLLRRLSRGRPVIWTAHDVLPFETTDADRERFAAIYRAADRVIVHSAPAAAEVRALAGVHADIVEHPVPARVARVPAAEARERLGLADDGRLLAALGFIRAYKGYGLLADVWEQLGTGAPRLLLMGELLSPSEQGVIDRLARHPRVELRLGYASDLDLQLAACAADALLLPYTIASDSGLVHLARAVGRPVLASDAPQLAASVTATASGAVVPRTVAAWSEAVTGPLPPPSPALLTPSGVGMAHLAVYRAAMDR